MGARRPTYPFFAFDNDISQGSAEPGGYFEAHQVIQYSKAESIALTGAAAITLCDVSHSGRQRPCHSTCPRRGRPNHNKTRGRQAVTTTVRTGAASDTVAEHSHAGRAIEPIG